MAVVAPSARFDALSCLRERPVNRRRFLKAAAVHVDRFRRGLPLWNFPALPLFNPYHSVLLK